MPDGFCMAQLLLNMVGVRVRVGSVRYSSCSISHIGKYRDVDDLDNLAYL